jgi:hypothetical protein
VRNKQGKKSLIYWLFRIFNKNKINFIKIKHFFESEVKYHENENNPDLPIDHRNWHIRLRLQ